MLSSNLLERKLFFFLHYLRKNKLSFKMEIDFFWKYNSGKGTSLFRHILGNRNEIV